MHGDGKTAWLKVPAPVTVRVEGTDGGTEAAGGGDFRFTDTFQIGRDKSCRLQLKNSGVSRFHAEVRYDGEQWWVRDLDSSNGTYLDGNRIQEVPLPEEARLELGRGGPMLRLARELGQGREEVEAEAVGVEEPTSATQIIERYGRKSRSGGDGQHTLMLRQAFEKVRKRESRKYMAIVGLAVLLLAGAGGIVYQQQAKLGDMRAVAEEIFYAMKALEVQVGQVETVVLSSAGPAQKIEIATKRAQLQQMQARYDSFLLKTGFFGGEMGEEERLIFRVARIFGECELTMSDDFVGKVREYIERWKTTDRLQRAIRRAEANGYAPRIIRAMFDQHLPPQFFYLALQESDFKDRIVGPRTRYGIAKGIWQFIPATAVQYGLRTGPLLEVRRYDPRDERFDFQRATDAAAKYLRDIYTTEAQASGLLVMASYNWGEDNVRDIIGRMPENPRERNFWKLLERYKIPRETYDYVFYIFSAAVIGENPRLFGFDFDNPLSDAETI